MSAPRGWTVAVRVGQVGHALTARWTRRDDPALAALAPRERALFDRLPPADRAHALRVADRLRRAGYDDRADDEALRALFKAALLHDVGKAGQGIRLHHRVAHVVLRVVAPAWLARVARDNSGWQRPFYALAHHAELGAEQAAHAGSDPLTIALVRHHDSALPPDLADYDRLLSALRAADDDG